MNKQVLFTVSAVVISGVVFWLWLYHDGKLSPRSRTTGSGISQSSLASSPPITTGPNQTLPAVRYPTASQIQKEKDTWTAGIMTPIRFYGKVVDEKGSPVEGATALISMHDRAGGGGSKITKSTDKNGIFEVTGHGLGLGVMVSKEGYYQVKESSGTFGYAQGAGTGAPHPIANEPARFVLRKMGQTEPLVAFERDFPISKDGKPVHIDLATGQRTASGAGAFQVEEWSNDQGLTNPNLDIPYDWRCRVSVPGGGGVIQRNGTFDFIAPQDGYQATSEIDMPVSLGSKWRSQTSRSYFVKLPDGRFARVEFTMTAGANPFFTVSSYLNPMPSNRNLEFDPGKR